MAKRKDKITVYLLEFCGKITTNGTTSEFVDHQLYYLNSRTKRVYREWLMNYPLGSENMHSYLMSTGLRSIAANERKYYTDAANMGRIFSDIDTYVTKLGEL